MYFFDNNYMQC